MKNNGDKTVNKSKPTKQSKLNKDRSALLSAVWGKKKVTRLN